MGKNRKKAEKSIEKVPPVDAVAASYPVPPARKAEDYLLGYNGYSYTAISAIAQELAVIDLHLYTSKMTPKGPETQEIVEHESISLLHYCNEFTTFYDILEGTQIYLELVGEAFWVILRDGDELKGIPREIYLLRPDWIRIVPDPKTFIKEYIYTPGGNLGNAIKFKRENIIHFKYFNPINPYRGRGSIQAGAMPIDIHNFAQDWNRNFFFNNATPSAVFTTDRKYSKPVLDRFLESWQNTYGGRKNAHKVAFMSGGFKLEKLGMAAKELDFTQQQTIMRDDILAIFKVPKTVLGLTDDVNKANAEATTRAFMERVITPRMRKFVAQLNEFYLPMFNETGLFIDFTDPSPEDVELKLKTYENALNFHWMTINEVRAMENLEPLEGGDEIVLPLQTPDQEEPIKMIARATPKTKRVKYDIPLTLRQPKHMMHVPPKRPIEIEKERIAKKIKGDIRILVSELLKKQSTEKKLIWSKEEREAFWRQFANKTEERESNMKKMLRRLWEEEEKEVIINIDNFKSYKIGISKGKVSSALPSLKDLIKRWTAVLIPFEREMVFEEGNQTLDFVGTGGQLDMTTDNVVKFVRTNGVKLIREINKHTREELRKTIEEGLKEEESISQLKARVRKTFAEFSATRAENIARTEVIRASNFATEEAYIQSGVVAEKEWLTSRDARVCPYCDSMDGRRLGLGKEFFKKGDKLEIEGSTLDFDLLDIDTPPLHPQCRCTLIPVIE